MKKKLIKNLLINSKNNFEKDDFIESCYKKPYIKNFKVEGENSVYWHMANIFNEAQYFIGDPLIIVYLFRICNNQFWKIPENEYNFFNEVFCILYYSKEDQLHYSRYEYEKFFMEYCAKKCLSNEYIISLKEFENYFNEWKSQFSNERKMVFSEFWDDAVNKLELVYIEKYEQDDKQCRFTRKTFQNFFLVMYILNKKESFEIADLFNKKYWLKSTFEMLYYKEQQKIEKYVFLPTLKDIFDTPSTTESFLLYLEKMYHMLDYTIYDAGNELDFLVCDYSIFSILKYIFSEVLHLKGEYLIINILPHKKEFINESYTNNQNENNYTFKIETLRSNQENYTEFIDILMGESLPYMDEYRKVEEYYHKLKKKYKNS